ncbi:MAG: DnaJ C-terminal domain-containing protein [Elusimicrobiota bacterium]
MANEYKDYYATLGVAKSASPDEVKKAYRRLAREHHPDLHPEKNKASASEKFKGINEAYEVLSDPAKRAKYDQLGPGWDQEQPAGPPPRRQRAPDFGGDAGAFSGFSDFFEGLYGQDASRGFGAGGAPRGPRRGQDVEADISISLEDAVRGGEKRLTLNVPALCPSCGGSGRKGRSFCPTCGGVGETQVEKTITARLPQAVRDGMKLRLRGQGGAAAGGEAGDLFLRIHLLPHPSFKVLGSDLETTVTVMPWIAALGGEASVATLDGPIRIKIPAGTHAGRAFRVAGKGLGKDGGTRGDLHAAVRIDIPEKLGPKLEKLFTEMRESDHEL